MNKLGIWVIAIAAAFVVGVLSANPVVEGASGWKQAFDDLLAQIISNDVDIADNKARITDLENQSQEILRFDSQASSIPLTGNRALGPTQMVGIDGTITKFSYRITSVVTGVPPTQITAIVIVNGAATALSCQVNAVLNTVVTCMGTGSIPVSQFDTVLVGDSQGIFTSFQAKSFATVYITPNP